MRTPAYIFPTLDDEPIVPSLSDFHNKKEISKTTSVSSMDHQTTSTTLRTSTKKPLSKDEVEELELDEFIKDKKQHDVDTIVPEEAQTLNKRDYGNFALLVLLCKLPLNYLNRTDNLIST